jgi:hypothetical protein
MCFIMILTQHQWCDWLGTSQSSDPQLHLLLRFLCATGPQELQLVMECAELHGTTSNRTPKWEALTAVLRACPYPALVEFNTRHGRTLLTLAERSLEAALAAAGPNSGSSVSSGGGAQTAQLEAAVQLASCLARCLHGGFQGQAFAGKSNTCEGKGRHQSDMPAGLMLALCCMLKCPPQPGTTSVMP